MGKTHESEISPWTGATITVTNDHAPVEVDKFIPVAPLSRKEIDKVRAEARLLEGYDEITIVQNSAALLLGKKGGDRIIYTVVTAGKFMAQKPAEIVTQKVVIEPGTTTNSPRIPVGRSA